LRSALKHCQAAQTALSFYFQTRVSSRLAESYSEEDGAVSRSARLEQQVQTKIDLPMVGSPAPGEIPPPAWFLPNREELENLLKGMFHVGVYWSASEADASSAWGHPERRQSGSGFQRHIFRAGSSPGRL
jgi:hypothetical protein